MSDDVDSGNSRETGGTGEAAGIHDRPGYDALWLWFGLSYASWLTIPRVLMHEMPDDWQQRMADLLNEFDETWDGEGVPVPHVTARVSNKYTKWPGWLLNYRHPDRSEIDRVRRKD